jgi:hypothetical protein
LLLLLVFGVVGCGAGPDWVGQVSFLSPRLCVARHAAMGDCFEGESASTLASLRIGECVKVTFTRITRDGPLHLDTIAPVDASAHPGDCLTH